MRKLIVVGLIVVPTCGVGFLMFRMNQKRILIAHTSNAKSAIQKLHHAILDYERGYSSLPLGLTLDRDQIQLTTGERADSLMASLCNPVEDESFKHPNFFTVKTAQGRRDGLLRNKEGTYAELFDPWGNPYHVLLDYDFDRKLTDPHTYEDRVGHNAIIWSPGPDGKTGTPSSNKDDIR